MLLSIFVNSIVEILGLAVVVPVIGQLFNLRRFKQIPH